jgi:hypothetical protein
LASNVSPDQPSDASTSTTELGTLDADRGRIASESVSARDLARELEELIAALDRRVPRVEQAGEAAIARDAAALRAKAVDRLATLATTGGSSEGNDSDPR